MAVTISRPSMTDDDGTLLTGTVVDKAFMGVVFDSIDTALTAVEAEIGSSIPASAITSGTLATARLGSGRADATSQLTGAQTYVPFRYAATVTNVVSTTAQTTAISFVVPANDMATGDVILIEVAVKLKNSKGSAGTVTQDLFWGASSITLASAISWANNATERTYLFKYGMQRVGADLWVWSAGGGWSASPFSMPFAVDLTASAGNAAVIVAPTFTSDQTVALKITLSASDANFYYKPQSATVQKLAA